MAAIVREPQLKRGSLRPLNCLLFGDLHVCRDRLVTLGGFPHRIRPFTEDLSLGGINRVSSASFVLVGEISRFLLVDVSSSAAPMKHHDADRNEKSVPASGPNCTAARVRLCWQELASYIRLKTLLRRIGPEAPNIRNGSKAD